MRERLEKLKEIEETHYVCTVNAVKEARAKIREFIASEAPRLGQAHHAELEQHIDELREAAARGMSIFMVLFGSPDDMDRFRFSKKTIVYAHEGDGTVVGADRVAAAEGGECMPDDGS